MANSSFLFDLVYFISLLFVPSYRIYNLIQSKQMDKIWIIYFLLIGIITILESTVLFPFIYILNKITPLIWTFVKIIVCVWLYHPTYQGALFLEKTFSKYIDMVCDKTKPILDPLFAILGVNQSHEVEEEINKKQE